MAEIDFTRRAWGHNVEVIDWPAGRLAVWCTPGPKVGDGLVLQGEKGLIRAGVIGVGWVMNVDDMYMIQVAPEGTEHPKGRLAQAIARLKGITR